MEIMPLYISLLNATHWQKLHKIIHIFFILYKNKHFFTKS